MNRRFFEVVLLIKRTCVATEEAIRGEFRLTQAEFTGLLAVGPTERVSGAEFSARMGLSPSRGSRVLSRLVKKGLLKSNPLPDNRRSVTISMTAKGARMRESLEQRMDLCGRSMIERLPARDQKKVEASFHLLEKVFETKP